MSTLTTSHKDPLTFALLKHRLQSVLASSVDYADSFVRYHPNYKKECVKPIIQKAYYQLRQVEEEFCIERDIMRELEVSQPLRLI